MRVNIEPQWERLANWYWEKFDQPSNAPHMTIWDLLQRDYGAIKAFNLANLQGDNRMWVVFPDEKSYTAFLLRWT